MKTVSLETIKIKIIPLPITLPCPIVSFPTISHDNPPRALPYPLPESEAEPETVTIPIHENLSSAPCV